jgi:quinol-cytochrome oxidoreductase complex cytochrome b subunit/mono/diheme cytochrome c family protein
LFNFMIQRDRPPRFFRHIGLLLLSMGGFLLWAFSAALPAAASPRLDETTPTATASPKPTRAATASPTMYVVTLTPIPTVAPTPTFDLSRLDKPKVNDDSPLQLDQGLLIYWGVCMACHGDNGQGLTDEWRDSFGEEDRNCWQSECHTSNHPPQGFEFPRIVPSLVGPGRLARFINARQLYEYNRATMPWWDPGSLTPEKAWAVTAVILKMNGTLPDGVLLNTANAQLISVHQKAEAPRVEFPWKILFAGILLVAAAGIGVRTLEEQKKGKRPSFVLHLHPPAIPASQARFRYTLGAGGLAVFLSLILLVTGLLEMYYYIPTPEGASPSIQQITFLVPFGGLVRNLHFWSAQALAVVASIHLLRVLLTGAYNKPRRFNYLLGLALLVFILLLDFTGYVLRWDEGVHWALVAGTNLLASIPAIGNWAAQLISGGTEPGPAMLLHYYSWHIFGLTLLTGIVLVWHLFRVRRDGGIAAPSAGWNDIPPTERIPRRELLRREIIAMLAAGGLLLLLSSVYSAPIAQPVDPTLVSLSEPFAPWFFLWVQELLKLGDPFLYGVAVPLLVLAFLAVLPYIVPPVPETNLGRWFPRGGRIVQIAAILLVIAITTLTILARW